MDGITRPELIKMTGVLRGMTAGTYALGRPHEFPSVLSLWEEDGDLMAVFKPKGGKRKRVGLALRVVSLLPEISKRIRAQEYTIYGSSEMGDRARTEQTGEG